jgi:hypothetical protein
MNLDGKSIIIVGQSGALRHSRLGKKIDEFDVVIRPKYGATKGYETYAGSKHTIWTSFRPQWFYIPFGHIPKENAMIAVVGMPGGVIDVSGGIDFKLHWKTKQKILNELQELWIYKNYGWFKYHFDVDMVHKYDLNVRIERKNFIDDMRYHKYLPFRKYETLRGTTPMGTNGCNNLWFLSNMVDHFYVTGIDYYGLLDNSDYKYLWYYDKWNRKKWKNTDFQLNDKNQWCNGFHNLSACVEFANQLIDSGKMTILDKDTKIKKSTMIYEAQSYCKICKKPMSIYKWQDNICVDCFQDKPL